VERNVIGRLQLQPLIRHWPPNFPNDLKILVNFGMKDQQYRLIIHFHELLHSCSFTQIDNPFQMLHSICNSNGWSFQFAIWDNSDRNRYICQVFFKTYFSVLSKKK